MWVRIINVSFILLISVGLSACQKPAQENDADRYPWQITILADGSSRIFGIQLGVTTAREAKQLLGTMPEVALFENPDGQISLEFFYKDFSRAGLSGRLVLTLMASAVELQGLKQSANKKTKMPSGAVQSRLDKSSLSQIESWQISAMTYMPHANINEETIIGRFGEPAEKIRSHEQAQHWLYPEKGLDLIINEAGKDIFQYVPPAEFEKLVKPLYR